MNTGLRILYIFSFKNLITIIIGATHKSLDRILPEYRIIAWWKAFLVLTVNEINNIEPSAQSKIPNEEESTELGYILQYSEYTQSLSEY